MQSHQLLQLKISAWLPNIHIINIQYHGNAKIYLFQGKYM